MKYRLKKRFYEADGTVYEPQTLTKIPHPGIEGEYLYILDEDDKRYGVRFVPSFVEGNKEFFEELPEGTPVTGGWLDSLDVMVPFHALNNESQDDLIRRIIETVRRLEGDEEH